MRRNVSVDDGEKVLFLVKLNCRASIMKSESTVLAKGRRYSAVVSHKTVARHLLSTSKNVNNDAGVLSA